MPPQASTLKNTSPVLEICILCFDTGDNKIFRVQTQIIFQGYFFICKPTLIFLSPWFGATERCNGEFREDWTVSTTALSGLAIHCNLSMYYGH